MSNILPEEINLAKTVARMIGRKWKLVEIDDLEAHLFLWLVENERYLERWRETEGDGQLFVSLRREAAKYCAKETKEKVHTDDLNNNNTYDISVVYKTLPYIFEYDTIVNSVDKNSVVYETITDILNAYNDLKEHEKELISLKYEKGISHNELAMMYNIQTKTMEKRIERIVNKIHQKLTGKNIYQKESNSDRLKYISNMEDDNLY